MTSETAEITRLSVHDAGFIARRHLAAGNSFRVGAVFAHSFYIEPADGPWFCVLPRDFDAGPLSLRCDSSTAIDWHASGVRTGMDAAVHHDTLSVGSRFRFLFSEATTWRPPPAPDWTSESLRRGLARLGEMSTGRVPDDGLGILMRTGVGAGSSSHLVRRAVEEMVPLEKWLRGVASSRGASIDGVPPLRGLLGLGPGLTPAGDDVLGGIMVALHGLGFADQAMKLYAKALPDITEHGNPVGASHLAAASEGAASEKVHAAMGAVMTDDDAALETALDGIDGVGHTSGWDALSGIVTVLRIWCDAPRRPGRISEPGSVSTGSAGFRWRVAKTFGDVFDHV